MSRKKMPQKVQESFDELMFKVALVPQVVVLGSEANKYDYLCKGMKAVVVGSFVNPAGITKLKLDLRAFRNHNVALASTDSAQYGGIGSYLGFASRIRPLAYYQHGICRIDRRFKMEPYHGKVIADE